MSAQPSVDWESAGVWAGQLTPAGPTPSRTEATDLVADLRQAAHRARDLALEASGLADALAAPGAIREPAQVLVVDRAGWARAAAASFTAIAAGPLPGTTGQATSVLALLATRVLGQFDPYTPGPAGGRLLLVAPNVLRTERGMRVVPGDFRLWVCAHEQTHALQFAAAPWLAGHIRSEVAGLLQEVTSTSSGSELAAMLAGLGRAVRPHLADLAPGSTVLVACSGGADSLALAAAVAFVAPREGWRAGAVVVDHGLQPGSAEVAERAAEQCRVLGLDPVEVVAVEVGADGGPEAAARAARHGAFVAVASRHGAAAVVLGHTLDDQAETVLLGLARGSGARSLAGMADQRGLLRRPFLSVRRAATAHACEVLALHPWLDPTNGPAGPGDELPLRSRLRHEVLPVLTEVLGAAVIPALARTADQLREDADLLDPVAAQLVGGPGQRRGRSRAQHLRQNRQHL